MTRAFANQLSGYDFWALINCLATGRRLVITSDHGYAATGYFSDAEGALGQFLKQGFGSGLVEKWIDFFVLHKSIKAERIIRRLK